MSRLQRTPPVHQREEQDLAAPAGGSPGPDASPSAPDGRASVAGVVPASGRSARMGTPKGLLQLHGRSFAWHVVTALRGAGCDPVLFVVRGDGSSDGDSDAARSLAAKALAAGAVVITNPDPDPGPISSLRLALDRVGPHADFVVWLPLDHPTVRPETVTGLIAEARRSGAPVTLPVHAGTRGHPAVFARALFPELLDPELPGGARTVVRRHLDRARLVDTDDPGVLLDVDTPADYRALLADAQAPEPPPIS